MEKTRALETNSGLGEFHNVNIDFQVGLQHVVSVFIAFCALVASQSPLCGTTASNYYIAQIQIICVHANEL